MSLQTVFFLALLPAFGNLLGAILAEAFTFPKGTAGLSLHFAAGIIFALIGEELMPEALHASLPWVIIIAFLAGGLFFILTDKFMDIIGTRTEFSLEGAGRSAIMISTGISIDMLSDGVMIGTGTSLNYKMALLLSAAQLAANIPGGFAIAVNFRKAGSLRKTRLLLAASFTLPIFIGAFGSFFLLSGKPSIYQYFILAFTAGILLTVAVEEMIREAHREEETYWSTICLISAFASFTYVSVYIK